MRKRIRGKIDKNKRAVKDFEFFYSFEWEYENGAGTRN